MLLSRIIYEVSEYGLMRDEQFGFRPRHSTSLQLARLVETITMNFGEKRLTGALFLDVAKAFDTVWLDYLLYKLTILNIPSYLVHTIPSCVRGVLDSHVISSRHVGWDGAGWIDLPSYSVYVNDVPTPSHHVELALYTDDMSIIATSRKPALLVC
jgi:hypothetical protein